MRFNVQRSFLYGLLLVLSLLFLGPYSYKLYSLDAILYFVLCCVLFLFGMSVNTKKIPHIKREYYLSSIGQKILIILDLISIVCAIYFLFIAISNTTDFSFAGGDFRSSIAENRSVIQRISEALMHISAPIYLIFYYSKNKSRKTYNLIVLFSYWLTPLAYLGIGARWSVFFYILLFFYVNVIEKKKNRINLKKIKQKINLNKAITWVILAVFFISVFSIVFTLFDTRGGINNADSIYMFEIGDIEMKGWAKVLYSYSSALFNPLFKILHYFSHSIPAFTYFFDNYNIGTPVLYGLFSLSVLQYILIPFGYSTTYMKNLLYSLKGSGFYMTFLHGYIVDFGLFFAPIFIMLTGYLFKLIEKKSTKNICCRWLYPYVIVMCFIAPIYNIWTVAMANIDMFFVILIYLSFTKISFNHKKLLYYIN